MRDSAPSTPGLPRPRRRFGQHFLADAGVAARVVEAIAPSPSEPLLEIGPGRGALTGPLLRATSRIAAVELDRDLAGWLRERYPPERLLLYESDVLHLDLSLVAPALGFAAGTPLAVAGNLPYNVSKPVAALLVRSRRDVARAVLMFQKEVAERLTATPGTRAYGPLTVLVGRAFRVEPLFDVPPSAFRPRPEVISTVTRWIRVPPERLPEALEPALRACLSACFARRRQTLLNNLRAALPGGAPQARALLDRVGIDPGVRAEVVPPEAFVVLAERWPVAPAGGEARG